MLATEILHFIIKIRCGLNKSLNEEFPIEKKIRSNLVRISGNSI